MALHDDINRINLSNMVRGFEPLARLSEGELALAERRAGYARKLEDEQRALAYKRQDATGDRAFETQERQAREKFSQEQLKTAHQFSRGQFEEQHRLRQKERSEESLRAIREKAKQYGVSLPDDSNYEDYATGIQKKAGSGLRSTLSQIVALEGELTKESGSDPEAVSWYLNTLLASDPALQTVLEQYPDLRMRMLAGRGLKPEDVRKELGKTGYLKGDPKSRVLTFDKALFAAKAKVAEMELENQAKGTSGRRTSPDYLQKLTLYKALNENALQYSRDLVNPDYLDQALDVLRKPRTEQPLFEPGGTGTGTDANGLFAPPARTDVVPRTMPAVPAVGRSALYGNLGQGISDAAYVAGSGFARGPDRIPRQQGYGDLRVSESAPSYPPLGGPQWTGMHPSYPYMSPEMIRRAIGLE